jgi:exonuclease III
MKILCLNVHSGGGARWSRILEFVEAHRADIVVFTEWRRSEMPGAAETWARSQGMQWIGACEGLTKNGVFIASALPFEATSATPDKQTAGTLLRVGFDSWTMLAAYFPQREAKARYFKACCEMATAVAASPFVLVGDLNTGNQRADRTPAGDKYVCAELFDGLSGSHGLVDLWRRTHGPDAREWSWKTKVNGFRLDHAFGNAAFVSAFDPACRYDHASRESKSTDHSALLISTGVASSDTTA